MKLAVVLVLSLATVAHADPQARVATAYDGPPGAFDPDAPPRIDVPPPPRPSELDLARDRALASRGFIVGSALTVPEGHVEVSGRLMVPVGVLGEISAGLTSSTELWADYGKLSAFDDEESDAGTTYAFGLKQAIVHDRTRQLAVSGSLRRVDASSMFAGSVVGSICSEGDCDTLFTVSAGIAATDGDTIPVLSGAAMTGSGLVHVGAELMWLDKGALGMLGARIGGTHLALELGVGLPLGGNGEKVIPLPMGGFGMRI